MLCPMTAHTCGDHPAPGVCIPGHRNHDGTRTYELTRPLDMALTLFEDATLAAEAAMQARTGGDHSAAGVWREAERSALQRAKVLATIAQAEALDRIADDAARLGLSL